MLFCAFAKLCFCLLLLWHFESLEWQTKSWTQRYVTRKCIRNKNPGNCSGNKTKCNALLKQKERKRSRLQTQNHGCFSILWETGSSGDGKQLKLKLPRGRQHVHRMYLQVWMFPRQPNHPVNEATNCGSWRPDCQANYLFQFFWSLGKQWEETHMDFFCPAAWIDLALQKHLVLCLLHSGLEPKQSRFMSAPKDMAKR